MKTKTLKSIFLLSILYFTFCIYSNAQIVYTDIPDTTITFFSVGTISKFIYVDLNNDGQNDFRFTVGHGTGSCKNCTPGPIGFSVAITTLNSNKVLDTAISPKVLNFNDLIKKTSSVWSSAATQFMYKTIRYCSGTCHISYSGIWMNQTDKYVGVKLLVNGIKHFGWIRVSVTNTSFTLKDYAYNSTPNHSIYAGATSGPRLTVSNNPIDNEVNHLLIYPNPATNSVTIKFPSDEAGKISIVNLFGQIVYSELISAEQKTIDVSKFSEGIYVVRWSSRENFETKTFSVIK